MMKHCLSTFAIFLSLFSLQAQGAEIFGSNFKAGLRGVTGHSYIVKSEGLIDPKEASCDDVVYKARQIFNTKLNPQSMVYDYAYVCLYQNFFIQFYVEPMRLENIDEVEELMSSLKTDKFFGHPLRKHHVANIKGNTRLTAQYIKRNAGRKRVVYEHIFKSQQKFLFENFSDYLHFKEEARVQFVHSEMPVLSDFVSQFLSSDDKALLPDVLKKSNFLTMQFPFTFEIRDGGQVDSLWVEGVIRYF